MSKVTGKARGGKARAENLSPEERSEIAKMGGEARWKLKATHQGILKINGKELPCAVLNTEQRILTATAVYKAFERPRRGPRREYDERIKLPSFMDALNLERYINHDVIERIKVVEYTDLSGRQAAGYDARIIPLVCDLYLRGREDGVLTSGQENIAAIAEILVRSLAQVGIIALVDEATGFQAERPQDALQVFLEKLIRKELAVWVQRFPEEFFENIYRLKGWHWPGMSKNRFSIVGTYIKNIVYERLAPGVIEQLEKKNPRDEKGNRKAKHHQWLTDDVGHPMLASHMQTILTLQRLSIAQGHGWKRFLQTVDLVVPKVGNQLRLPIEV